MTITVKTPNLSGSFEFTTQSKDEMGTFTKLDDHDGDGPGVTDPQPDIIVGNIMGGMGTVTITPSNPVEGDRNVEFTITFKAAGRMITNETTGDSPIFTDRAGIRIAFPFPITPGDIKSITGGGVAFTPGATDNADDDVNLGTSPNVDITIPHLNKDQTIVIMTNPLDLTDTITELGLIPTTITDEAERKSSFGVNVETSISVNGTDAATPLTFTAIALANAGDDATVTGGLIRDDTDPGKLTITPAVVERGKAKQSITITYEALRTHFASAPAELIKISLPDTIAGASIGAGVRLTSAAGTTLTHAAGSHDIMWSLTSQLNRGSKLSVRVQIDVPDSTEDLTFNYITGTQVP